MSHNTNTSQDRPKVNYVRQNKSVNSEQENIFSNIFESFRCAPSKKSIKIVLLGDGAIGKTSYFNRISSGDTDEYKFNKTYDATRGCNICQIEYTIGKYSITIHLFDTAGQEKFGALRDSYLMGADGIILMYDLTEITTKQNILTKWIPDIKRVLNDASVKTHIPVAIVGNKNDRIDITSLKCNDHERPELNDLTDEHMLTNTLGIRSSTLKSAYNSQGTYKGNTIEHFYISVKADENLLTPINWLLENILEYYIPVDAKRSNNSIKTFFCNDK